QFALLSLLPPILALLLALWARNVIPALLVGGWRRATLMYGGNPFMWLYATFSEIILPNLADVYNITVLVYCGLFGVLIVLMQKTGGAHAIARAISNKVKSPKGAQGSTTLFGIIVFFDDYFNALTVGSVMRP